MHPQAILVDSTSDEEQFFLSAVRDEARGTPAALIELPSRPGDSLAWVTKLDSSSLFGRSFAGSSFQLSASFNLFA